jgi:hypothetical protein
MASCIVGCVQFQSKFHILLQVAPLMWASRTYKVGKGVNGIHMNYKHNYAIFVNTNLLPGHLHAFQNLLNSMSNVL